MGRSPGISGLAVGVATAGGLLLYTGIRNVPLIDGLRDVLAGKTPGSSGTATGPAMSGLVTNVDQAQAAQAAAQATAARQGLDVAPGRGTQPGQGVGPAIVDAARGYMGKPYVWAGDFSGGGGGDCSGLVFRALNDAGVRVARMTALGYMLWPGAATVGRDQCAAGDLACWAGHIGIAVNNTQMINAPHAGAVVQVNNIWGSPPPVIRRVTQA